LHATRYNRKGVKVMVKALSLFVILISLALSTYACFAAPARHWQEVYQEDNQNVYVDTFSVFKGRKLTAMYDFDEDESLPGASEVIDYQMDCNRVQIRVTAFAWYDGQMAEGTIVQVSNRLMSWTGLKDDARLKTLYLRVCAI
jgi:hypothetical protein